MVIDYTGAICHSTFDYAMVGSFPGSRVSKKKNQNVLAIPRNEFFNDGHISGVESVTRMRKFSFVESEIIISRDKSEMMHQRTNSMFVQYTLHMI